MKRSVKQAIIRALPLLMLGGLGALLLRPSDSGSPPPGLSEVFWQEMDLSRAAALTDLSGWDVRRGNYQLTTATTGGLPSLAQLPEPMVEGKVFATRQMWGQAGVRARMRGDRPRRNWPRFSIGLHQTRELHLRAFPGEQRLELVACDANLLNENLLAAAAAVPWPARPEDWFWLELTIHPENDNQSRIQARIWQDGSPRPAAPQLTHRMVLPAASFLGALQGAPFSLRPIFINAAAVLVTGVRGEKSGPASP